MNRENRNIIDEIRDKEIRSLQQLNCPDMTIEDEKARIMQLLITEKWDEKDKFKMHILNDLTSKLSKEELIETLRIALELKDNLLGENVKLRQYSTFVLGDPI